MWVYCLDHGVHLSSFHARKTRWKGGKRKAGRSLIPDRKDISERPAIVDRRGRRGDWEGDTVHGQDAHLVTLVDRKSRLTLIGKVPDKKAATVAKEMIRLMKRVPGSRTITLDNGGEFAQHGKVSKKCGVNVYFAKPYASYQRGTNEKYQRNHTSALAEKNGDGRADPAGHPGDGVDPQYHSQKGPGWKDAD